jgi:hypothetical protein
MNFLTAFSMSPWCHGNREGRSSTMPCSTTFVARRLIAALPGLRRTSLLDHNLQFVLDWEPKVSLLDRMH